MITNTIKFGGTLEIGDFIGVGSSYGMEFGWFSGNGKSGTIQYIRPWEVKWQFSEYNKRMNNQSTVQKEPKDRRGFGLEHFSRDFVRKQHFLRIVKITCPDDVFTGKELQDYLEAKRILQEMKFLKR